MDVDADIRPVRPEEYEEAGRVTAGAYMEFAPEDDSGWQDYLKEIADVAGRVDRTEVFVAVEDGRILGCVTLELDQTVGDDDATLPPDVSCIRMLGVDESARGRGLGRALVNVCLDRSREAGKKLVTLRTTALMVTARRMYESMGFEADPERDMVYDDGFRLLAYRLAIA